MMKYHSLSRCPAGRLSRPVALGTDVQFVGIVGGTDGTTASNNTNRRDDEEGMPRNRADHRGECKYGHKKKSGCMLGALCASVVSDLTARGAGAHGEPIVLSKAKFDGWRLPRRFAPRNDRDASREPGLSNEANLGGRGARDCGSGPADARDVGV